MQKIIIILLLLVFSLPSVAFANEATIAVGIALHKLSVQINGQSGFAIQDMSERELLVGVAGQKGFLNVKKGQLYFNDIQLPDRIKVRATKDGLLEVNRRVYKGDLRVSLDGEKTIFVVNEVPLEDYLQSVVPNELNGDFSEPVVKAQTVAMRSWAYQKAGRRLYVNYDVQAYDYDGLEPLYSGKVAENEKYRKWIQETAGEVLLHRGKVAQAMWHRDSGGLTESGKNFWGFEVEYLPSIKDWHKNNEENNIYRWQKEMTAEELDLAFARGNYKLGKIVTIKISKLQYKDKSGQYAADRTSTGRLKLVEIVGEQGELTLDGEHFARILGLESTRMGMSVGEAIPKSIGATVKDGMGNEVELVKIDFNVDQPEGYKMPGDRADTKRIPRKGTDKIIFYGWGKGHGVGMSQQGAEIMADQALEQQKEIFKKMPKPKKTAMDKDKDKKAEEVSLPVEYYKTILAHYFPHTKVSKEY